MIVVKHVDSIFGSLLPIRLSTFKLVVVVTVAINTAVRVVFFISVAVMIVIDN